MSKKGIFHASANVFYGIVLSNLPFSDCVFFCHLLARAGLLREVYINDLLGEFSYCLLIKEAKRSKFMIH